MDYKHEYEEMVRRCKELHESGNALTKAQMEIVCPQLVESEDERTRKEIHAYLFNELHNIQQLTSRINEFKRWLAWLENQNDKKQSAVEVLNSAGLKTFRDGNQWCVLVGDNIQEGICGFGKTIDEALWNFLKDFKEQKPAEWSEEDEYFFKTALWHISYSVSNGKRTDEHCRTTDWLKGVKERLKSLRPKPHWKPSEEQMAALKEASTSFMNETMGNSELLCSLYNDLKKL